MKGKNKFKMIAIILEFVLLFQYISVIFPFLQSNAETITDDNGIEWSYTISDGNAIAVRPVNTTDMVGDITIPDTLDGYTVTSIGSSAFSGCSSLTSINIPSSVTSIGSSAFYNCSSLTSIDIPSSVTSIGISAFSSCSSLTSIELPEGITSIGSYAFNSCSSLTSIDIPSSVTSIESYAFEDCSSLTSIEIPDSVTSIRMYAFYNCSSLTSIDIPSSVTSIGIRAFYNCSALTSVEIPNGVTKIENSTFEECSNLKSVNIPNSVTSIGMNAFKNCNKLDNYSFGDSYSLTIPASVTSIGDYAFYGCTSLWRVKIEEGVTSIGNQSFYNPSFFIQKHLNIWIPSSVNQIGTSNFNEATIWCEEGSEAEDYAINNRIEYIYTDRRTAEDDNGISWYYHLANGTSAINVSYASGTLGSEVEIPSKLDGHDNINIQSYEQDNQGTNIFGSNSDNITTVVIQDGAKSIGEYAFAKCSNLTSVKIPSSVTSISQTAFLEHNDDLVIKCIKGSAAYKYAIENSINIELILEYKFKDKNLYDKVKEQINQYIVTEYPESLKLEVSEAFVLEKTSLDISNAEIEDLSGIENLTQLTELNASGNKIEDIEKISYLNNLTTLNLSNNKITSIDKLSSLKKLNALDLSNNSISNIDNLKYLTNLSVLKLENNKIVDITQLGNLTNLSTLDLSNNSISIISALDSLNIANLNLNNQSIETTALKEEIDLPDILKKATESKYTNEEEVTYTTDKSTVENNKIIISNEIGESVSATVTVNNGIMNGTTYTIKAEEGVTAEYYLNGDKLEIKSYKDEEEVDTDMYYSIDGSEYKKYTEPVLLKEGTNNVSVKFFNKELINSNINVAVKLNAIRKNGKIYIYSDSYNKKSYSFTGENLVEYTEAIENTEAKIIFVKIGENEVKEITVQDTGIEEDTEIYDMITGNSTDSGVISKDGVIRLNTVIDERDFEYNNIYYSFDKVTWVEIKEYVEIKNTDDTIYVKFEPIYTGSVRFFEYEILNDGKLKEATGVYNENGSSYIFGDNRTYELEDNLERTLVISDENKIDQLFDEEILDATEVFNEKFILKKDGIAYKVGNSYSDLQKVNGSSNFIQIDGKYALDRENNIWKCSYDYDNNTYIYEKCDYELEGKIERISYVEDVVDYLNVLYANGKNVIFYEDSTKVISNGAIYTNSKYTLEYDKAIAISYSTVYVYDLSSIVENGEIPIKINKMGYILTDKGNLYDVRGTLLKSGVKRLGDYTYEDTKNNVFYYYEYQIINQIENLVEKNVEDIIVKKDETVLTENKVNIYIEVPNDKYTIKLPDGKTSNESSIKYEVTENGVYTFEFTDANGYNVIRVVHVTSIQNRKETKVPEVTVIAEKVKLESDEEIEYSLDKENWIKYTSEIEYTQKIYARVKNDKYECSIIEITINENGELEVYNSEERKIQGQIFTNGVGYSSSEVLKENLKVINFASEVAEKSIEASDNQNKSFFKYISDIADNIIYSFSSTDGRYAGCYFEDNITEVTYKDLNNNSVSVQDDELTINDMTGNNNIDYSIIVNSLDTIEDKEVEIKKYVYIDNQGNLVSDIDIINIAKEVLGEDRIYTKIVGDGTTFYLLTQEGEVYVITGNDNGVYNYLADQYDLRKPSSCY